MCAKDNFASATNTSGRHRSSGTPPLTPLLAPLRTPLEKQFPISLPKIGGVGFDLKKLFAADKGD